MGGSRFSEKGTRGVQIPKNHIKVCPDYARLRTNRVIDRSDWLRGPTCNRLSSPLKAPWVPRVLSTWFKRLTRGRKPIRSRFILSSNQKWFWVRELLGFNRKTRENAMLLQSPVFIKSEVSCLKNEREKPSTPGGWGAGKQKQKKKRLCDRWPVGSPGTVCGGVPLFIAYSVMWFRLSFNPGNRSTLVRYTSSCIQVLHVVTTD